MKEKEDAGHRIILGQKAFIVLVIIVILKELLTTAMIIIITIATNQQLQIQLNLVNGSA